MYPRNAASPEPIAIGPVVQISDGAVQTAGVTVRIKPVGVAEGNGAGTTAFSTDGVVLYTPTQGETNYTSFVLIASKSGCIPASQTVITSESTVSGRVYAQTIATTQIDAIADQVWDESYSQHTTAGSFGKLQDNLRKANTVLEGTILASPTPTTTVFRLSGIGYPTGALTGSVLWLNSGVSQEQNSPILSTLNNGDGTVTVTLENALVTAPSAGDTVLIDPTSHVHSVAEIQAGLGTIDNQRYLLSILAGATSNAGTAGETYTITISGSTYTVTYAGLDSVGNRGTTAFAKT
jgi:hypothetical protein